MAPPPIDLEQRQAMSLEDRLALLERDAKTLMTEVDIALNYVQAIGHALGLAKRLKKLDDELDVLRGNGWDKKDRETPTDPVAGR